jgi:hypothetical protein
MRIAQNRRCRRPTIRVVAVGLKKYDGCRMLRLRPGSTLR